MSETPTLDQHPELAPVARICHEVNRAWCEYNGDNSQKSWDDSPAWQRESAAKGVLFHIQNPEAGDEASHNSWLEDKATNGWKFGETKNEETKEHPCFVPFDQLPREQQFKDRLFRTIVHAGIASIPAVQNL